MIEQEERAYSNSIESLSIDAIGFNGALLKALSNDADGPQVTVFVPPKPDWTPTPGLYQAEDFQLNQAGDELTCPNGEATKARSRDKLDHGWVYRFKKGQCVGCSLRANCLKPETHSARTVRKNDFQAQYEAAKQRATTDDRRVLTDSQRTSRHRKETERTAAMAQRTPSPVSRPFACQSAILAARNRRQLQTHPPPLTDCAPSAACLSCGQREMAEIGKPIPIENFLGGLLKHVVTILCDPNKVCRQSRHAMAIVASIFHRQTSSTRGDV